MCDFKMKNEIKPDDFADHFPPVLNRGISMNEVIDDRGLINSKEYESHIGMLHKPMYADWIGLLKQQFNPDMIDEMVMCLKKRSPELSDLQIYETLSFKLNFAPSVNK